MTEFAVKPAALAALIEAVGDHPDAQVLGYNRELRVGGHSFRQPGWKYADFVVVDGRKPVRRKPVQT